MSLIYTSPTSRHNLYLGGKVDAKSLATLKQRNILRILNVTPAKEAGITAGVPNYFESNKAIKYKRISVYDASTSDLLSHADEIVNFISSGLHHGSVLVHCQRGVSRSATAVIFFLMRRANMTYDQGLQLCKQRRSVVDPIQAFCEQLKQYEKECRELGYLTAVDTKNDEDNSINHDGNASAKKESFSASRIGAEGNACSKRKAEVNHAHGMNKKRVVGPSIGPTRPSIGPSRPSIGPSSQPSLNAATIGPEVKGKGANHDPSKDR